MTNRPAVHPADQAVKAPGLAIAGFVPPPGVSVRIVAPDIVGRDAVGNFCFDVRTLFVQNGVDAELYAEHCDAACGDIIRPVAHLAQNLRPSDTILYFFSTVDPRLPSILQLECASKVAYYHGVTRPEAFGGFDPAVAAACATGIAQTPLLQGFDRLAANSATNVTRLVSEFGADTKWKPSDIPAIGPRIIARQDALSIHADERALGMRLLAVGRIKAHKKLEHVLELFAEILKIDAAAELSIVGGGGYKAYSDRLAWVQREHLRLPEGQVRWLGSVGAEELTNQYRSASAYVSMSEDEGFGVPLLEAMLLGVPVVAYDIPATREVLDGAGLLFSEKHFSSLARRVTALLSSAPTRRAMIEKGLRRARVLASAMDGRSFLSFVFP